MNQNLPDNTTEPRSIDQQQACSALLAALDDGQEVKMFKLMGAGAGYCVTIHGDCCCEARSKPTLEEAITAASKKYEEWGESSGSGDDDDGCPTI